MFRFYKSKNDTKEPCKCKLKLKYDVAGSFAPEGHSFLEYDISERLLRDHFQTVMFKISFSEQNPCHCSDSQYVLVGKQQTRR